jgi:hypothetical protein
MYKLIKYEILYNKQSLLLLAVLTMTFTLFALINIVIFKEIYFLEKYSWSALVGLGAYGIVFYIWSLRVKEKREIYHCLLPVALKKVSIGRWIWAILPFVTVLIYLQLLHFILSDSWQVHIGRISAQIGFLSMFLAALFITRDIRFIIKKKNDWAFLSVGFFIFLITALGAILIIMLFNYEIVKPLYMHDEELLFFIWGLFISAWSTKLFVERRSYLE